MKRKKKSNRGEKRKVWERGLDHQFYLFRQLEHMAWNRIVILTLLEQKPMYRTELAAQYSKISGYYIKMEQLQKSMNTLERDGLIETDHLEKDKIKNSVVFRYFRLTPEGVKQRDLMVKYFNEFVPLIEEIIEENH